MDLVLSIDLLVFNAAHYTAGGDVVWHNDWHNNKSTIL